VNTARTDFESTSQQVGVRRSRFAGHDR
jgi:hypothetical protein